MEMTGSPLGHMLRAGVARSDITTDDEGALIRDRLYAKALVIDDGKTKIVIITMDVTAIGGRAVSQNMLPDVGEEFLPTLRARIENELGIPGGHVLVNASHTHPPGRMLCDDDEQVVRTFDAVRRAIEGMTCARIGSGSGHEDGIMQNRTLRLKNGKAWTLRHTNPSPVDDEVAGLGPIDAEIGLIRIDRTDGTPLAIVYNFACHPLFGNMEGAITANFPGIASRVIEENLGHDTMALFLQGAGGDVMDVNFKEFGQPRDVEPMGRTLGLSALAALRDIETKDVTLDVANEMIQLPRRTDIPERLAELQQEQSALLASLTGTTLNFKSFLPLYLNSTISPDYPMAHRSKDPQDQDVAAEGASAMDLWNKRLVEKYLGSVASMEKLARIQDKMSTLRKHQEINDASGEETISAEVMGIRIGECILISSPAEMLTQVGLNIKEASPCEHTFVAAFSNGYIHYSPPADDYDMGGYEVTECLLAPEWQRIYEDKASEIIRGLI
jgi:hypothetical protein